MSTRRCRIVDIPGPPGTDGLTGAAGADGVNAFTLTVGDFTVPAVGDVVTIEVVDSSWMVPAVDPVSGPLGQVLVIEFAGSFMAVSLPDETHVELYNLGYTGNAPGGTVIPDGATVSPGGLTGPAGVAPGGALAAAANLSDVDDPPTALANLGAGLMAVKDNVTDADISGAIAIAHGGTGSTNSAAARSALGVASMGIQDAGAVAITGGVMDGVAIGGSAPAAAKVTTLEATGASTLAAASVSGKFTRKASAVQTIAAGSTILVNAPKVKVVGSAGPVTVSTLPTLSNGTVDGDEVLIQGTDDTNTVTIQDDGTLVGSRLRLGANNRVLGKGDSCLLSWDNTEQKWYEVAYSQPI